MQNKFSAPVKIGTANHANEFVGSLNSINELTHHWLNLFRTLHFYPMLKDFDLEIFIVQNIVALSHY